jgi:hypothetical protein
MEFNSPEGKTMRRSGLMPLLLFLMGCALVGCDGNVSTWAGIPSTVKYVTQCVHDATGWALNKCVVRMAKVGDVRLAQGVTDSFVADFTIEVHHGGNSFQTTAKDVPCDRYGIPTQESVTKLKESVEDIKAKFKQLQV